jgi:MFS family permease
MIFWAVLFWSVMQCLCGFAGSYGQLFAARVGLGLGEAALPPAAYSLIRDGVQPKNRGRAFSIYQMGPLLGGGAGALVGGIIYGAARHGAFRAVPLLGALKPWQTVIAVPGIVGVLAALLMLSVREPPRDQPATRQDPASYGATLRLLGQHWRLYLPIFLMTVVLALATGWTAWMPAALTRLWGLSPATIGKVTGPLGLILTPIAYVTVGQLMDRFTTPRRPDGMLRVAIAGSLLNLPAAVAVLLAPSVGLMWVAYALSVLITGAGQVAVASILAEVTPGRLMGKVTSLQFLAGNILGLAMGPTLFALVAKLFTGPRAIADAMLVCYPAIIAVTVAFMALTARELRRLRRTAEGAS